MGWGHLVTDCHGLKLETSDCGSEEGIQSVTKCPRQNKTAVLLEAMVRLKKAEQASI